MYTMNTKAPGWGVGTEGERSRIVAEVASAKMTSKYGVQYQSDRAYESIRDGILTGTFPPGTQLNERIICEKFDLSRTPVRHAFAKLTSEGLVEQIRNVGVFVRKLTLDEWVELMEARRVLEAGAAALAAEKADKTQVAELLELGHEVDTCRETGSSEELLAMERLFHEKIIAISRNAEMHRIFSSVHAVFLTLTTDGKANPAAGGFSHSDVAATIAAGDATRAFTVMWRHLGDTVERIRAGLSPRDDPPGN